MRPMQTRAKVRARPIGAIEIASSMAALGTPRGLHPVIDRLRHDVRSIVDALSGKREPSFTDPSTPRVVPVPLGAIDPIAHALPRGRLRSGWSTLRTDVSWLLRDLRGQRRPALVPRAPRSRARRRSVGTSARPLRVAEVIRETDEAVSVVLTEASGAPIAFEAGQFLTFHLNASGELMRRAYSLSSSPLDGRAIVTVKRMGRGSALMHALSPGDTVFALGPSGSFVAPSDRAPAHLVMVAGGSGITPVIAIAETALRERPALRVSLIYGNRAWRDVIFADRLAALSARFPDRLRVEHVLHDPEPGWTGARGLLDRAALDRLLDPIDPSGCTFYLCGPAPMMDAAREALAERGVDPTRIREERFRSPRDARPPLMAEAQVARIRVDGRDHVVRVEPGQTLLEAGLAAGADLPFSCAMGGCGACKVKLVAGAVHTEEPSCLSPRERDEGFVLTCCSRPTSAVTLEVRR